MRCKLDSIVNPRPFEKYAPTLITSSLPREDHLYKTTDESFRFYNRNFDEMRCKLDSTENPRPFKKYPTPP